MSTLGERIKNARKALGLKQDELAKKIGVKANGVISNWERDQNKPDAEQVVKLCHALQISAEDLLDVHIGKKHRVSDVDMDLAHSIHRLDNDGKKFVSDVIRHEHDRITQIAEASNHTEAALPDHLMATAAHDINAPIGDEDKDIDMIGNDPTGE